MSHEFEIDGKMKEISMKFTPANRAGAMIGESYSPLSLDPG